jgi:hypothetical protein
MEEGQTSETETIPPLSPQWDSSFYLGRYGPRRILRCALHRPAMNLTNLKTCTQNPILKGTKIIPHVPHLSYSDYPCDIYSKHIIRKNVEQKPSYRYVIIMRKM